MKNVKKVASLIMALLLLFSMAACGEKDTFDPNNIVEDTTTLDIMCLHKGYGFQWLTALKEGFEKANPGVEVKITTISPKSEYIMENYDHVINNKANTDGYVRAYGFAVNDDGETCYYENSGVSKTFQGTAVCTRDDVAQLTVYEISIPWSSLDLNASELDKFGLTFSINSTNEEDEKNGTWRNLVLFDGGGVINRNDWAKIPEVTLVH